MSKRTKKYSKISSMDELRVEKEKLHRLIRMKEEHLEQDWEWLKEKYSPRNLINELICKTYQSSGIIRKVMLGFGTIKSFLCGEKSHHSRCRCGCED